MVGHRSLEPAILVQSQVPQPWRYRLMAGHWIVYPDAGVRFPVSPPWGLRSSGKTSRCKRENGCSIHSVPTNFERKK